MKVIKTKNHYFPLIFPHEIKNGKFIYFIKGQGYKTTTKFSVLNEEIPNRWGLSWLNICKIYEKYGPYVAIEYADTKVAGIIAKQTLNGYYSMYMKAKEFINDIPDEFFELCKCTYELSIFGVYILDIVSLDEKLDKLDPEYNSESCLYKEKPASLKTYIQKKYGENVANAVKAMNK